MSKNSLKSNSLENALICKIKVTFFISLSYEMNFVLEKQCFRTSRKKCDFHSNSFSKFKSKKMTSRIFSGLVELSDFDNYFFFFIREEGFLQAALYSNFSCFYFISTNGIIYNIICKESLKSHFRRYII